MNTLPIDLATWFLANFCGLDLRGKISLVCKDLRGLAQSTERAVETVLDRHFQRLALLDAQIPVGDKIRDLAHTERLSRCGDKTLPFADRLRGWITWRLYESQGAVDPSHSNAWFATYSVKHGFLLVAQVTREDTGWFSLSVTKSQNGVTVESRLALVDITPDQLIQRLVVTTSHTDAVFVLLSTRHVFDIHTYVFRYDFSAVPSPLVVPVAGQAEDEYGTKQPLKVSVVASDQACDSWRYTTGFTEYTTTGVTPKPRGCFGSFGYTLTWAPVKPSKAPQENLLHLSIPCLSHGGTIGDRILSKLVIQGNGISVLLLDHRVYSPQGPLLEHYQIFAPIDPLDASPLSDLAWHAPPKEDCNFLYAWWADSETSSTASAAQRRHWYIVVSNTARQQWQVYRNDDLFMYKLDREPFKCPRITRQPDGVPAPREYVTV